MASSPRTRTRSTRRVPSERSQRLQQARQLERTRIGTMTGVAAIMSGAACVALTIIGLQLVIETFGVMAHRSSMTGSLSPLLLTEIVGACLAIGGILMILPRREGWWLVLGASAVGLLDIARIYRGLFASVNTDHPRAAEVVTKLTIYSCLPAVLYLAVLVLVLLRVTRASFRIGDARLPAHEPEPEDGLAA